MGLYMRLRVLLGGPSARCRQEECTSALRSFDIAGLDDRPRTHDVGRRCPWIVWAIFVCPHRRDDIVEWLG